MPYHGHLGHWQWRGGRWHASDRHNGWGEHDDTPRQGHWWGNGRRWAYGRSQGGYYQNTDQTDMERTSRPQGGYY